MSKPERTLRLAQLPVVEMTINELELEREVVKAIYNIFRGTSPDDLDESPSVMDGPTRVWSERLRDIENELLERTLLI